VSDLLHQVKEIFFLDDEVQLIVKDKDGILANPSSLIVASDCPYSILVVIPGASAAAGAVGLPAPPVVHVEESKEELPTEVGVLNNPPPQMPTSLLLRRSISFLLRFLNMHGRGGRQTNSPCRSRSTRNNHQY
jgi:hypothetical protein